MTSALSELPVHEPTAPHPPRYWWLKRLALAVLLWSAAITGLYSWWNHESQRRVRAVIDEVHARGEPILVDDFARPDVPPSQNAALDLMAAARALVPTKGRLSMETEQGRLPFSADDLKVLRSQIRDNAVAIES